MIRIQPAFEGAEFLPQFPNPLRVFDGGIDLQTVADDACIRQQTGVILFGELRNFINVEAAIGFTEIIRLFQDRDPG
jgi:hypothetical protein